jgi:hypothetical protein
MGIASSLSHNTTFENPSHWYYQLQEIKKHYCGPDSNGIIPIPDFIKIHSPFPSDYMVETAVRKAINEWQCNLFDRQTDC